MKRMFTGKDEAVIKYFLLNGNKLSYQKRISEGAGVSEQHLGDHCDENGKVKKEGRLSKLVGTDILDMKWGKVQKRGDAKLFFLKEDPTTFRKMAIEFLKDKDIAVIFTHSTYAQKMMDCVAKEHTLLYEDNDAFDELKKMLRLSPKMFELCLTVENLGRKFLLVSSKTDYYGISEIAFEKTFSKGGAIKHYIRWQLFRSCLKTDVSFIVTGRIPEEIDDLLFKESIERLMADATLNEEFLRSPDMYLNKRMDAYGKALFEESCEELAEAMKNPEKFPEKIKELKGGARESEELFGRYFFSWDSIPGNDNERLLRYLSDCLGIDWADDAEIRKSDDVKTIYISKDENSVEILIDEENEKATLTLKIRNGITHELNHELKVKNENGKLNIYTYTPEL